MTVRVIRSLVALLLTVALAGVAQTPAAREDRIAIGSASLYVREIGHGRSP